MCPKQQMHVSICHLINLSWHCEVHSHLGHDPLLTHFFESSRKYRMSQGDPSVSPLFWSCLHKLDHECHYKCIITFMRWSAAVISLKGTIMLKYVECWQHSSAAYIACASNVLCGKSLRYFFLKWSFHGNNSFFLYLQKKVTEEESTQVDLSDIPIVVFLKNRDIDVVRR